MTILRNKELLDQNSDFIHFISYVNCPDLFLKAVRSTGPNALNGICIVLDNRSDLALKSPMQILSDSIEVPIPVFNKICFIKPDVPLTTAQTMNFMLSISASLGKDFFTWIHSDGEVTGDSMRLVEEARKRMADKWGAIFTRYDVYCAFNVQACLAAGEWDWLRFPFYFLDNDYYRRLRDAGYPTVDIGGDDVLHHNDASNTIKNDETRSLVNSFLFPVSDRLYKLKWEGI